MVAWHVAGESPVEVAVLDHVACPGVSEPGGAHHGRGITVTEVENAHFLLPAV